MIRKMFVVILSIVLSLVLFACGNSEDDSEPTAESDVTEEEVAEDSEATEDAGGIDVGSEITNEHGVFEVINLTSDRTEIEVGPLHISGDMAALSGDVADNFVEIIGEEIDYVLIDIRAENISEDIINFEMSKARMVTNTGEEIEQSDLLMSDYVQEEIRPGVGFNGSFVYLLEESTAADIESVHLTWDAPENEAGEAMTEEIELELAF